MSDHWITLIPTDPEYVPDAEAPERARALYASFVPDADEVTAEVWDEKEFICPNTNFERVLCPFCGVDLTDDWWGNALDESYAKNFSDLQVVTPCCQTASSLNDLQYEWSAGFARFELSVMNPNVPDIEDEKIHQLEQILGCTLRKIWIHL